MEQLQNLPLRLLSQPQPQSLPHRPRSGRVNVLLLLTGQTDDYTVFSTLSSDPRLQVHAIRHELRRRNEKAPLPTPVVLGGRGGSKHEQDHQRQASPSATFAIENGPDAWSQISHDCSRWADVLYIEADAGTLGSMLAGLTDSLFARILRCWNLNKWIILTPQMSVDEWRHPLTKRQMVELERLWPWVLVLGPALWDVQVPVRTGWVGIVGGDDVEGPRETSWDWEGPEPALKAIYAQIDKVAVIDQDSQEFDRAVPLPAGPVRKDQSNKAARSDHIHGHNVPRAPSSARTATRLPPEIWTMITEALGDWEYAAALHIYTRLPTPSEWVPYLPRPNQPRSLEYLLLTCPFPTIRKQLDNMSTTNPSALSGLAVKIIFKFSLTAVLSHLATHQKDIFWSSFASFGLAPIPHKASVIYNNPCILQWWLAEPAIIKREYGPEAINGASRAGFVDVLDWWAHSGLEMRYTEKALEAASAKGHISVLNWWKRTHDARAAETNHPQPLPLEVGRSILCAAQAGRTEVIAWWDASGIPYPHEESVARLASTHGHVAVLDLWRSLKGNKMIFDNQVLVGATKGGHVDVLEWWKSLARKDVGLKVEYKTCDIEEAMEDSLGGSGEAAVREWWERNGLNLGVGPNEWLRVKTLGN